MNGANGHPYRLLMVGILAFVDCIVIIAGVFVAEVLRFEEEYRYIVMREYSVWKIIAFVFIIQIGFYYFGLYELIHLRRKKKIAFLLLESLGISFLLLAIVYYSIPLLAMGRGILGLGLMVIFVLAFFWRLIFGGLCRNLIKERILIVGTGELSKKIVREIYENGRDGFEIIGIVEE